MSKLEVVSLARAVILPNCSSTEATRGALPSGASCHPAVVPTSGPAQPAPAGYQLHYARLAEVTEHSMEVTGHSTKVDEHSIAVITGALPCRAFLPLDHQL